MRHMNDLCRNDHRQSTARPEHRYRGEHKRHPSVCVLGEWQVQLSENLLCFSLEWSWQILISNEGRIADYRIKFLIAAGHLIDGKL